MQRTVIPDSASWTSLSVHLLDSLGDILMRGKEVSRVQGGGVIERSSLNVAQIVRGE